MFIANQHGDEYVVSEGMLSIVRTLAGNSTQAKEIRNALTVTIVPRVNVDGFDGDVVDSRGSTTPGGRTGIPRASPSASSTSPVVVTTSTATTYSASAYDHPYKPGADTENPVPEAVAMRLLWDERQPSVVVDFHHQGSHVDDDGRLITGSIMWPNATEEAERLGIADEFAETITMSKRAVSIMLTSLEQYGYANITRYPSTSTPASPATPMACSDRPRSSSRSAGASARSPMATSPSTLRSLAWRCSAPRPTGHCGRQARLRLTTSASEASPWTTPRMTT